MKFKFPKTRILTYDCECRPLSYTGNVKAPTTDEITAIAAKFNDEEEVHVFLLGELTMPQILRSFVELWDESDAVAGHYIKPFDNPMVNGMLLEQGMDPLQPKLSIDTKCDLIKFRSLSKSQQNLFQMLLGFDEKQGMSQMDWREANRLTHTGLAETQRRVVGDVLQHEKLRRALTEAKMLKPPKTWRP